MKKIVLYTLPVLMALLLGSCTVVGGIFKAGMAWGIILVVIVIAAIIFLITRAKK